MTVAVLLAAFLFTRHRTIIAGGLPPVKGWGIIMVASHRDEGSPMQGYSRCASTSCWAQAAEFVAGVPLCSMCKAAVAKALRIGQSAGKRNAGSNNLIRQTYAASLPQHSDGIVYYVTWRANDEHVKIGTTTNAKQRFTALSQMGTLRFLVAEPGGTAEELVRHHQFAHLRKENTELFRYTDEIIDHIAELRKRYPYYRDLAEVGRLYD
ncbi:hypothetical protein GPZ77_34550 (plasmid) [Streptomyces sp. QHH-9511]|uniref:GIY-YIG nuclease family protein n=1 Tax=Streptomyces sp. QHH-9511 TaxID=2684468 RepID=UPI0013185B6B|nr:GIY-YIG nuclease family protein [Streptomyces sp. QHH-9511]QGZ53353.1 hypothetical protein GPZ77_34550 [Streptomyces sp. QHH-9511]